MQSFRSYRGFGVFLGIVCSLALCILSWRLLGLPWLQEHASRRLSEWQEGRQLSAHYQNIRLGWGAVRIEGLELEGERFAARGAVDIQIGIFPRFPIRRVILSDWQLRLHPYRSDPPTAAKSSEAKGRPSDQLQGLKQHLQRLQAQGIPVEVRSSHVTLVDRDGSDLLSVEGLHLSYSAEDAAVSYRALDLLYRQAPLLRYLNGQLLLSEEEGAYPFLLEAKDYGDVPWHMQGSIRNDWDALELRHKRRGLPGPILAFATRFLQKPEELPLLLKLRIQGLSTRDRLDFDVQIASNGLALQHAFLGENAWGPFPFSWRVKGQFVPRTGTIEASRGLLHVLTHRQHPPLRVHFSLRKADLLQSMTSHPWDIELQLPETPCQLFLDLMPKHAFPLLDGFALGGSIHGRASLSLLPKDRPPLRLDIADAPCTLAQVPETMSRAWLLSQLKSSPSSASSVPSPLAAVQHVPLDRIAEDFLKSVIVAEDGGFWRHEGFRLRSLLAALQANIRAGKVLYGGSTLTMQLAKNLYLHQERVLSRKLQELMIAWALEQQLSKEEILELYANIVEFGPQLRGIGRASHVYFGKAPHSLNQAEAIFLASILPSPHRHFHENFCSGRLQPKLVERMQQTALGLAATDPQSGVSWRFPEQLRSFRFAEAPADACGHRPILSRQEPKPQQAL